MDISNSDQLFYKVWRNKYLKSCIFKFVKLYMVNEYVRFNSRSELVNYKFREYISVLNIKFDEPLQVNDIPSNPELFRVEISYAANQKINFQLPDNVVEVILESSFNQPLKTDKGDSIFPSSTKTIVFGFNCRQKFGQYSLPSSLENLSFYHFNQPLEGLLPSTLKTLSLGFSFNKTLNANDIPSSVQSLSLSFKFNKPLVLPPFLVNLHLGHDFNQPLLPGDLPATLKVLSLGVKFNQPLPPGVIPNGVESLKLSDFYSHPLSINSIPQSVTKLILKGYTKYLAPLVDHPELIPSSVTNISFSFAEEIPLSFANLISSNHSIMSSVTKFSFTQIGYSFYSKMIPKNVTHLVFNSGFVFPLGPGDIPFGITQLTFQESTPLNLLKPNSIPSSVKHLSINSFDNILDIEKILTSESIIPSTINEMTLAGSYYNYNHLNRIIPKSISTLTIIYPRGQFHKQDNIPSTVSKTIVKKIKYDPYNNYSRI